MQACAVPILTIQVQQDIYAVKQARQRLTGQCSFFMTICRFSRPASTYMRSACLLRELPGTKLICCCNIWLSGVCSDTLKSCTDSVAAGKCQCTCQKIVLLRRSNLLLFCFLRCMPGGSNSYLMPRRCAYTT